VKYHDALSQGAFQAKKASFPQRRAYLAIPKLTWAGRCWQNLIALPENGQTVLVLSNRLLAGNFGLTSIGLG
jgi:hypothetical protein